MHVLVNGVRLFFDVEGGSLVPDGPAMREKPTRLLPHGGPGLDHSIYKPAFSGLSDVAQVVFLDHRGNGRSDPGPREGWTLAQWADDVHAFCETLGISRPIVYGASFGGTVALAYATRHPEQQANAARPGRGQACRAQSRGHALVHAAGRGGAHVRFRAPALTRPVSDPRARRGRRSDDADRMSGGCRGGAAGAPGSLRALRRLWPRRRAGCARARDGRHPRLHRKLKRLTAAFARGDVRYCKH